MTRPHPATVPSSAAAAAAAAARPGCRSVACLVLVLALAACSRPASPPGAGAGAAASKAPPLTVGVIEAKSTQVPIVVDAVGQAEGSRQIEVRAQAGGILLRRLYQEGAAVQAHQPLYRIDPAPYEIALAQARAQLEQQQARLEQAEREQRRLDGLARSNAVSRKEFDDATSARDIARGNLAAAEASVREAELNLSYTTVVAPIAGIAGRSPRSEGTLVSSGSDSLLTTIEQIDPVWVRFSLPDADFQRLRDPRHGRLGVARVAALLADGTSFPQAGRVNFEARQVDPRLATVELRAEFPNPGGRLLPGQFVRIRLAAGSRRAWLVPQAAVLQNDQGPFVYVLKSDQTVQPRPVVTAGVQGAAWVVTSGLNDGEKLAADNLLRLKPGTPVKPLAAPSGSSGSSGS